MAPMEYLNALSSGALSGTLTAITFQPFDVMKTRQQQKSLITKVPSLNYLVKTIWRESGIGGLWRGTSASILRVAPGAGINFWCISVLMENHIRFSSCIPFTSLHSNNGPSPLYCALAGAVSRGIAVSLLSPVAVIKTRMESSLYAQGKVGKGVVGVAQHIITKETLGSFYKGLIPTLVRDIPFSGLYLGFYSAGRRFFTNYANEGETIRQIYNRTAPTSEQELTEDNPDIKPKLHAAHVILSAAFAAFCASILTHPPDVIRTRQQLPAYQHDNPSCLSKRSIRLTVQDMVKTEGWNTFWRGAYARLTKRTLSTVLVWTLFDRFTDGKVKF